MRFLPLNCTFPLLLLSTLFNPANFKYSFFIVTIAILEESNHPSSLKQLI